MINGASSIFLLKLFYFKKKTQTFRLSSDGPHQCLLSFIFYLEIFIIYSILTILAISLLKELKNESVPKNWNSSDRFHSLEDYLVNEGIVNTKYKIIHLSHF